ncbi:Endopolyphosphatase [Zopfia rhizophila CBS 207.26]|uniref:Endopolyphosphatase n=1 Tax=Zopfia rhizophila CBS 207.26 TaxID=1314779 RepID=A0A6A6DV03_9PEZI|nr:Endopolyphosphatase [Zopfia rhizophila CBS 207.26]
MLLAWRALFWGLCSLLVACRAAPPFGAGTESQPAGARRLDGQNSRKLHGRFLHISDIHPDPFYKTYSSTKADAACHRRWGPAGVYGAETSGCDTPIALVNETFKWIQENLKDTIDFVVWTGDSARHDNDEKIPRTQRQIIEQNEFIVTKFTEVFGKSDNINDTDPTNDFTIPIVPTFGNNDIMPHNIFLSGPNKWTLEYLDIWRNFIPEEQRHQFQEGGWFRVEVIPGKLAVISLNSMYFFDSNSGVDGCADKHEPGYEHMEWLRIQLQILRDRGMKAILIGHVPPARTDSKLSWDETCWQKYALWQRQYRDIIVANLFGHMNIDHFMLQDFKDLKKDTKNGRMASSMEVKSMDARENMLDEGEITIASASDYLLDLRNAWAKLPSPPSKSKSLSISEYVDAGEQEISIWQWVWGQLSGGKKKKDGKDGKGNKTKFLKKIGGRYGERFSITHVSPSVVPNYFPTLRIFMYNTTGLEDLVVPVETASHPLEPPGQTPIMDDTIDNDSDVEWRNISEEIRRKKKERESQKRNRKYKFKIPQPPSKSSPPGPAYSPQTLTLTGYVQYFANLTHINNDFVEQSVSSLGWRDVFNVTKWKEGKHGKYQGKKPKKKPHAKKFMFEVEYNTTDDKLFKLNDLTVRSYLDLARRIGGDKSRKALLGPQEEGFGSEYWVEVSEDEIETDKKGKHKKKKKHHKKKKEHGKHKHKKDSAWFTFVKRAFVGSMDPDDIEEMFCEKGVDDVGYEYFQREEHGQEIGVVEL